MRVGSAAAVSERGGKSAQCNDIRFVRETPWLSVCMPPERASESHVYNHVWGDTGPTPENENQLSTCTHFDLSANITCTRPIRFRSSIEQSQRRVSPVTAGAKAQVLQPSLKLHVYICMYMYL